MISIARVSIARIASVAFVVAVVAACNSSGDDGTCDCADNAIIVNIPVDIAPSVSGVQLSGTACIDLSATCTNFTGGCSQYRFAPDAVGTCHVEVDSSLGTFAADVTVTQGTGCCSGVYPSPTSAGTINVPEPDGGGG
jgi:hypothetical protein